MNNKIVGLTSLIICGIFFILSGNFEGSFVVGIILPVVKIFTICRDWLLFNNYSNDDDRIIGLDMYHSRGEDFHSLYEYENKKRGEKDSGAISPW